MSKRIIIVTDYGIDYGPGRVKASYDNGNAYEEIKNKSFDKIDDALGWLMNVFREEEYEENVSKLGSEKIASGVLPAKVSPEVHEETAGEKGAGAA